MKINKKLFIVLIIVITFILIMINVYGLNYLKVIFERIINILYYYTSK